MDSDGPTLVPSRNVVIAFEDLKGNIFLDVTLVDEFWWLHILPSSFLTFLRPLARLNPTIPAPTMRTGLSGIVSVLIRWAPQ